MRMLPSSFMSPPKNRFDRQSGMAGADGLDGLQRDQEWDDRGTVAMVEEDRSVQPPDHVGGFKGSRGRVQARHSAPVLVLCEHSDRMRKVAGHEDGRVFGVNEDVDRPGTFALVAISNLNAALRQEQCLAKGGAGEPLVGGEADAYLPQLDAPVQLRSCIGAGQVEFDRSAGRAPMR